MAGVGPPPKDPAAHQRQRNRHPAKAVIDPAARLAEDRPCPPSPGGEPFSAYVEKWWATWATSPQATQFLATDWQRLEMIAPIIERYGVTADLDTMKEIRIEEALLGATMTDRLRLRMTVSSPTEAKPAPKKRRFTVVDEATG